MLVDFWEQTLAAISDRKMAFAIREKAYAVQSPVPLQNPSINSGLSLYSSRGSQPYNMYIGMLQFLFIIRGLKLSCDGKVVNEKS